MEQQRRTALITGSAKGLGKMTALMLAEDGYNIVLNYVNSEKEAFALQREIEQLGVRCIAVQADVSRPEQIKQLVQTIEEQLGSADIVINNAGPFIRERRLFVDYTEEEIMYMLHGNLTGVMLLDHLVLPSMRKKGWGRIIHFGFGHASEGRAWPHRAVYAAAKVGLVSFTKTLAVEEASHGVTVNMVCPGDIRGEHKELMIEDVSDLHDPESPRGRPGSGEDIARVIQFLCDRKSDFVTGNTINVSGGLDPIRTMISKT
ncbi:SDR family oxidoreductase [Paenibacillus sp. 481]|uniref:SDR family oxidoreductase n=1 Tax=Paenibacillus sp. 481 TaxID=2835869 RepID=UPI001E297B24|nr:SDR family oxidoreductase [Paenibacillus sp. 481]UHA74608.1 SDR family oxidoreductase [Paenibacillus sp. 481]